MDIVVDLDDMYEETDLTLLILKQRNVPDLRCTIYASPNRLGPVQALAAKYPWVEFGIHGWEHTHAECLEWTEEKAHAVLAKALDMGYAPVFKPPSWAFDRETAAACAHLGVVLHHHNRDVERTDLEVPELLTYYGACNPRHISLHTHLVPGPVTDNIDDHPGFTVNALRGTAQEGQFVFVSEFIKGKA